jgi:hypothetical protein
VVVEAVDGVVVVEAGVMRMVTSSPWIPTDPGIRVVGEEEEEDIETAAVAAAEEVVEDGAEGDELMMTLDAEEEVEAAVADARGIKTVADAMGIKAVVVEGEEATVVAMAMEEQEGAEMGGGEEVGVLVETSITKEAEIAGGNLSIAMKLARVERIVSNPFLLL